MERASSAFLAVLHGDEHAELAACCTAEAVVKGLTPAGAGWAEAVSRPTRYSESTLLCGFFFHSMVDAPPVRYDGEHFSPSDREKYTFQILGNAREIY